MVIRAEARSEVIQGLGPAFFPSRHCPGRTVLRGLCGCWWVGQISLLFRSDTTLAFLSGFKYMGPRTGNDQGGSWVCVNVRHALLISVQGPLLVFPSLPTPSHPFPSRSHVVKCVSSCKLIIGVY